MIVGIVNIGAIIATLDKYNYLCTLTLKMELSCVNSDD